MATATQLGHYSTAIEALQGADLTGKGALVTGGNSGIGVETVRALAHAGASVILTSRSIEAGQKVADEIKASGAKGSVAVEQLDLADLASVRALAGKLVASKARLDFVILNAGIMACPPSTTKDGFEMQIGTNVHGHLALALGLLPHLKAQGHPVRIVFLSSSAHSIPKRFAGGGIDLADLHWQKRKYKAWGSYGQSKLADLMIAREMAKRLADTPVKVYSVDPGAIKTPLQRHSGLSGFVMNHFGWLLGEKTTSQGASTSIYGATAAELESQSGAFLVDCKVTVPSQPALDDAVAAALYDKVVAEIEAGKPLP